MIYNKNMTMIKINIEYPVYFMNSCYANSLFKAIKSNTA
jgi:hypothetical protein